jgi:hypothetical protein
VNSTLTKQQRRIVWGQALSGIIVLMVIWIMIDDALPNQQWSPPNRNQVRTVTAHLISAKTKSGAPVYGLDAPNGEFITLHCEPDPPLDECLNDKLVRQIGGAPVTASYIPEVYSGWRAHGDDVLLLTLSVGDRSLISLNDTANRIIESHVSCSKNSCVRAKPGFHPFSVTFGSLVVAPFLYFFIIAFRFYPKKRQ